MFLWNFHLSSTQLRKQLGSSFHSVWSLNSLLCKSAFVLSTPGIWEVIIQKDFWIYHANMSYANALHFCEWLPPISVRKDTTFVLSLCICMCVLTTSEHRALSPNKKACNSSTLICRFCSTSAHLPPVDSPLTTRAPHEFHDENEPDTFQHLQSTWHRVFKLPQAPFSAFDLSLSRWRKISGPYSVPGKQDTNVPMNCATVRIEWKPVLRKFSPNFYFLSLFINNIDSHRNWI